MNSTPTPKKNTRSNSDTTVRKLMDETKPQIKWNWKKIYKYFNILSHYPKPSHSIYSQELYNFNLLKSLKISAFSLTKIGCLKPNGELPLYSQNWLLKYYYYYFVTAFDFFILLSSSIFFLLRPSTFAASKFYFSFLGWHLLGLQFRQLIQLLDLQNMLLLEAFSWHIA